MGGLAHALAWSVWAEQVPKRKSYDLTALLVAEIEDLGRVDVAGQDAAGCDAITGHAFHTVDESSVGLGDDRLSRPPEIQDGVTARWSPPPAAARAREHANVATDVALKLRRHVDDACTCNVCSEVAVHLHRPRLEPLYGVQHGLEVSPLK